MGLSTREVSAAAAASAAASSCFRIESCEISSNASLKSALTRRGWGPALAPARRTAALRGGCAVLLVASESEAEEAAAEGVHDEGIDSISLASGVASPSDARRDVGRGISATGRAKWNVVVARPAPTPVRSQLSTVKTRRSLSQPHAVPRRHLAALLATLGRRPPLRPAALSAARCPSTPRRSPTRTRRPPTPSRGPPEGAWSRSPEITRDCPRLAVTSGDYSQPPSNSARAPSNSVLSAAGRLCVRSRAARDGVAGASRGSEAGRGRLGEGAKKRESRATAPTRYSVASL